MGEPNEKAICKADPTQPLLQNNMGYFTPELLDQALRVSDKLFQSGCFGKDVHNAAQAFVKIQAGAEMGMPPMEAMNSLYIVNGNITIWGKALAGRLKAHGWDIEYKDCDKMQATVIIHKNAKEYSYTAKKEEVELKQAYKIAPENKLKYHALRQLINFYAPEVLNAVSYTAEEVEEMGSSVTILENPIDFTELKNEIINATSIEDFKKITERIGGLKNVLSTEEIKELRNLAKEKKAEIAKNQEVVVQEVEEAERDVTEEERTGVDEGTEEEVATEQTKIE